MKPFIVFKGIAHGNRERADVRPYIQEKDPLPLVLPETMTLDNYTSAQRVYYTKAVFPVYATLAAIQANKVSKNLSLFVVGVLVYDVFRRLFHLA